MMDALLAAWNATSLLEWVSVAFGVAYIILATKENIWCWPAALIGTATAIILFWDVSLLMESGLNVYYLVMALYGWYQWRYGSTDHDQLAIQRWQPLHHAIAITVILALSVASGVGLERFTQADYPFVDSFTTWAAVFTTWMVARKVLENWLYWIVIDAVSVWLFWQKGLYLYALLFVAYTVIAVFGYREWRTRYQHATQ
ncbi:nicotinamide mononucleotide transporter [Arenicella chitinivorans]|uniref:Nicotinamide riboside transporter PnuC n=1 Tax=Arenicella chitinivorans TaxID=1329800 RepID=A0A918S255_9GAMM|nr:nicotinamide riboside transporter PnuC [Arenicella chitinivorans]GHA18265.1 nicotinamide mononucleotide transporter [Arenicella chitinivorans]